MGLEQGKKGMANLSDDIRRVCGGDKLAASLEAYQNGFNTGWSTFCTSFHGFEMGKKGDIFKSYCPVEKEILFREKYLIGKMVYEKKDQLLDFEDKVKELTTQTEKNPNSSALKDELKLYKDNWNSLKREIEFLELKGLSLVHTN